MESEAEELGRRLALARQSAGLTQEEVASRARLERSGVAKIETGRRRVTALELARLAEVLDIRVEWFLEDPPPAVVSRRNAMDPGEPSPVIDRVAERVAREVEFLVGFGQGPNLCDIPGLDFPTSSRMAETLADEARNLLGYKPHEPAKNLSRHAADIGLLAFSFDLGEETADGASILLARGGVAIVNGTRRLGRRRLTLAHELGHYLFADEFSVDWRVADENAGKRESSIDRFARAVLLPAGALREVWETHRGNDHDLRTAAVLTGSEFRVDMATLARRLKETRLISGREVDRVRAVRTTRADIVDFDLLVPKELAPPELPRVYEETVLKIFRQEYVSAGRALELLFDTWMEDDLPDLPKLPEEAIWKFVS